MNQIKKFLDRISMAEARNTREVIMPLQEAKELRDEITKVLLDMRESKPDDVIQVVMRGSSYK